MKGNYFWRVVLIGAIVLVSVYWLYPPWSRDLVQVFREKSIHRDTNFTAIVERALELQKKRPDRQYANLLDAVGTNDIVRYFPYPQATNEANPTTFVLNRLQREAAGKVRLGIDLKGGTSFLLRMDTNKLDNITDTHSALSQAVEVLRKRVDKFGVAEPIIETAGSDRIDQRHELSHAGIHGIRERRGSQRHIPGLKQSGELAGWTAAR